MPDNEPATEAAYKLQWNAEQLNGIDQKICAMNNALESGIIMLHNCGNIVRGILECWFQFMQWWEKEKKCISTENSNSREIVLNCFDRVLSGMSY